MRGATTGPPSDAGHGPVPGPAAGVAPPEGACGDRPLRVLLADDHAVLRAGLRLLIDAQPDLQVVSEAGDGEAAVTQAAALAPSGAVDVVVLDISMPRLNGLEALRRIKAAFPHLAVLMLTMHASEPYLFQVIQAGGSGYVLKQTADEHLLRHCQVDREEAETWRRVVMPPRSDRPRPAPILPLIRLRSPSLTA